MKKCPFWTQHRLDHASEANSFKKLGNIALNVLAQFPDAARGKIVQVCGPVSTGGFDSVKVNFLVLAEAVRLLRVKAMYVFDQTPLEEQFVRLWKKWKSQGNTGYCWPILEDVYRPLFESKLIGTLLFLPGWEYSVGSCWERSQALALKMKIMAYPQKLYKNILLEHGLTLP